MDVQNPITYDLMCQYGLVKPIGERNGTEEVSAFNLYPRPSYNGGIQAPPSTAL